MNLTLKQITFQTVVRYNNQRSLIRYQTRTHNPSLQSQATFAGSQRRQTVDLRQAFPDSKL